MDAAKAERRFFCGMLLVRGALPSEIEIEAIRTAGGGDDERAEIAAREHFQKGTATGSRSRVLSDFTSIDLLFRRRLRPFLLLISFKGIACFRHGEAARSERVTRH